MSYQGDLHKGQIIWHTKIAITNGNALSDNKKPHPITVNADIKDFGKQGSGVYHYMNCTRNYKDAFDFGKEKTKYGAYSEDLYKSYQEAVDAYNKGINEILTELNQRAEAARATAEKYNKLYESYKIDRNLPFNEKGKKKQVSI